MAGTALPNTRPVALPAPLARLVRGVAALSRLAGVASAAMILAAVGVTCQMIFVRFVLGASTLWQTEAVIFLVIGATLVGLSYVQLLRGHVNVDLVPSRLPRRARRALALATLGLTAALVAAMAWHGFRQFETALIRGWRSDSVWGPPLWVPYLAMPLGFGLYLLQLAADLVETAFEPEDAAAQRDRAERR